MLCEPVHVTSPIQPSRPPVTESYGPYNYSRLNRDIASNNSSEKTSYSHGTNKPSGITSYNLESSFSTAFLPFSASSPPKAKDTSLPRPPLLIDTSPYPHSIERDQRGQLFPFSVSSRSKQSSPVSKKEGAGAAGTGAMGYVHYDESPPSESLWGDTPLPPRPYSRVGSFTDALSQGQGQGVPSSTAVGAGGAANNSNTSAVNNAYTATNAVTCR